MGKEFSLIPSPIFIFFFFISALFSSVVISRALFSIGGGVDKGIVDIGSIVRGGSACWLMLVVVLVMDSGAV